MCRLPLSLLGIVGWLLHVWAAPLAADEPYGQFQFSAGELAHWSFTPVVRPEIPAVEDTAWVRHPIDAFVLARLEKKGLRPSPPADKRTLLRRAYLDLIGLPPKLSEQEAFLADESPEAFARVVDQLLARPQYGERWARHWLDVVRYAESNGYERDNPKPHAWRYRDWVIAAFNRDQPYDEFLTHQLAGDELPGANAQTHIAATFLRLGLWDDEPADEQLDRYDQLDDVLAITCAAFMAQTIRCARCHDHKYEPFSQFDYARLLARFEPLRRPQNERDDLDRHVGTAEELAVYRQGMAAADEQAAGLRQQIGQLEAGIAQRLLSAGSAALPEGLPAEALAALAVAWAERTDEHRRLIDEHRARLDEVVGTAALAEEAVQLDAWRGEIARIDAARPAEPPRAYVWYEEGPQAPAANVFSRGDPNQVLAQVEPGFPAVLVAAPPPSAEPTPHSSGRRLQLARWLASPDHPLTARVMVNRIWQHHLGDGLAGTENDFGLMGETPTHPELLDWLAAELVAGGWTMKRLHRQIMLSNTYQQDSSPREDAEQVDPDTDLLWRFPPRRLEAEAVRDGLLAASGQLNQQAGGPSVFPPISREVLEGQSRPGSNWATSTPDQAARRSIYVFVKRTLLTPEMELLDLPGSNETCEDRPVSTVAPQALTCLNGELFNQQAGHFADRLLREAGADPAAQIERAFRLALCRPPAAEETAAAAAFLIRQQEQIAADAAAGGQADINAARQALAALCLVLFNTNEFFYMQ